MKHQKHYTSQKEIDRDVAKAKRDIIKFQKAAEEHDKMADYLAAQKNPNDAEQITDHREQAKLWRDKAWRIEAVRLVKLKRLSASLNTMLLPGITTDASVVLENL